MLRGTELVVGRDPESRSRKGDVRARLSDPAGSEYAPQCLAYSRCQIRVCLFPLVSLETGGAPVPCSVKVKTGELQGKHCGIPEGAPPGLQSRHLGVWLSLGPYRLTWIAQPPPQPSAHSSEYLPCAGGFPCLVCCFWDNLVML